MKRYLLCLVIVLSAAASCSSGENGPDPSPVTNAMSQGSWRVTQYIIDDGADISDYYDGYVFTFGPDEMLTATNGIQTYAGSWSVQNFDNDRLEFLIGFDNPETFSYLTNSWRIRFRSDAKITLDINEFNYVTFEKI